MNAITQRNITIQSTIPLEFSESHKKKIESTQFVLLFAQSHVGKTYLGDYLEAMHSWKHIRGDVSMKNIIEANPNYFDLSPQIFTNGTWSYTSEGYMWKFTEEEKASMAKLARITLDGANESNKVVLTFSPYTVPMRSFLRKQLADAGAKDVSVVFLDLDTDARMQGIRENANRISRLVGKPIEEVYNGLGINPNVDFDSFVKFQKAQDAFYQQPQQVEQPFSVIDITPSDSCVLERLDQIVGIQKDQESLVKLVKSHSPFMAV